MNIEIESAAGGLLFRGKAPEPPKPNENSQEYREAATFIGRALLDALATNPKLVVRRLE